MTISLVPEQGPFRKSCLYRDGILVRRISHAIIALKACSDPHFFEALPELEYKGALAFSLRALSRQMLHSSQLSSKLQRHFVPENVIQQVIKTCQEQGFLSDDQVVDCFVAKWERQGKSQLEIRERCRRLGLPALKKPLDEKRSLTQLITKKYKHLLSKELSFEERAKAIRALIRRGFSYDLVQDVLHSLF